MFDNVKIIIPARRNSKGLPFKNRLLFNQTINTIPPELKELVLVSTDDEVIIELCIELGIKYDQRKAELAEDETSTLAVMMDLFERKLINGDDVIIMLYLTYPERTWIDIAGCLAMFKHRNLRSLLCKKKLVGTHPYLYLHDIGNGQGQQIIKHNLYRRQDYPKVFEISHFMCIFKGFEVDNNQPCINNNLYGDHTIFYDIDDVIDIDTYNDLVKYEINGKNNS